jgi:outer membrane protein assembly factor BamD
MKKALFVWIVLFVSLSACSKFNKIRKNKETSVKYEAAVNYYEKKDYSKSLILLEDIEPLVKGTKEAEKVQFLLANCYYKTKQYELASFQFKKFYETYPRSEWAEECLYLHAYALYNQSPESELDQTPTLSAIQSIQAYLNSYPQSKRIEEANGIIKELRSKLEMKAYQNALLFYNTQNYKAAIQALANFEKDYPDSDFMEEVSYRKLETAYNLARQSILSKKVARLNEAITFYEEYKYKFPNGKYLKDSQDIYETCVRQINEIKKLDGNNSKTENQTRTPNSQGNEK